MAADQRVIIPAEAFGKYKMFCLIVAALLLMLNVPRLYVPGMVVLSIGMMLSMVSGIDYVRKYLIKIL
jgi:phosphatidylglycerophosphate synthase